MHFSIHCIASNESELLATQIEVRSLMGDGKDMQLLDSPSEWGRGRSVSIIGGGRQSEEMVITSRIKRL